MLAVVVGIMSEINEVPLPNAMTPRLAVEPKALMEFKNAVIPVRASPRYVVSEQMEAD